MSLPEERLVQREWSDTAEMQAPNTPNEIRELVDLLLENKGTSNEHLGSFFYTLKPGIFIDALPILDEIRRDVHAVVGLLPGLEKYRMCEVLGANKQRIMGNDSLPLASSETRGPFEGFHTDIIPDIGQSTDRIYSQDGLPPHTVSDAIERLFLNLAYRSGWYPAFDYRFHQTSREGRHFTFSSWLDGGLQLDGAVKILRLDGTDKNDSLICQPEFDIPWQLLSSPEQIEEAFQRVRKETGWNGTFDVSKIPPIESSVNMQQYRRGIIEAHGVENGCELVRFSMDPSRISRDDFKKTFLFAESMMTSLGAELINDQTFSPDVSHAYVTDFVIEVLRRMSEIYQRTLYTPIARIDNMGSLGHTEPVTHILSFHRAIAELAAKH